MTPRATLSAEVATSGGYLSDCGEPCCDDLFRPRSIGVSMDGVNGDASPDRSSTGNPEALVEWKHNPCSPPQKACSLRRQHFRRRHRLQRDGSGRRHRHPAWCPKLSALLSLERRHHSSDGLGAGLRLAVLCAILGWGPGPRGCSACDPSAPAHAVSLWLTADPAVGQKRLPCLPADAHPVVVGDVLQAGLCVCVCVCVYTVCVMRRCDARVTRNYCEIA